MPITIPNKARSHKTGLVLGLLVLQAGVLGAQSQRARLLAADRALADSVLARGLVSALSPVMTTDAVLLYPDAPVVQGRDNIGRLLKSQPALDSLRITWQPQAAELAADSTLGASWGTAVVNTRAGRILLGRYIAAWTREPGGWRLAALLLPEVGHPAGTLTVPGLPVELPARAAQGNVAPFVQADGDFSRLAGDSGAGVAFRYWAAPDAMMPSGAGLLVQGPAAIGRLVAGPDTWQWYAVAAGAAADGTMGWTVGQAVITPPAGVPRPSKYLTIWRQTPAGIRFVTDGGSARPSPGR